MPPKGKKQKEIVQDDRLQAIVLTDSFQTRFMPLTSVKPRCLLPLANVPLIEYTLEFLAKANVDEVYLMCCSHADQIQNYIDSSKWGKPSSPFKVHCIMSLESRSVGDAMRDVDNRGIITGDFLLVSGDVVTNIQFDKVLAAHRHRRALDRDHIVTMVLEQAAPQHRTRPHYDPAVFILDKKTNRCLYYQGIPAINGARTSVNVDPEMLEGVDEFVVRNDLIDCHVDICSPHVPQIFQENFDYQSLRHDFVRGVLSSDLVKKTMYTYVTAEDYVARVNSWQTYDAVSQDVLERWCYPIAPDSNLLENQTYKYESKHIYKEKEVILSRSCKIGSCVEIGAGTFIGDGTRVEKSIIGRNCKIGKNVHIKNAYVWDNTTIHDNAVVKYAIVASDVVIEDDVTVSPGSVIGYGVVVGKGCTIPNNTRLAEQPVKKMSDSFFGEEQLIEESLPQEVDRELVGETGQGFLYDSESDMEDEDDSLSRHYNGIMYNLEDLNVSDDSIASTTVRKVSHKRKSRRSDSSASYYTEVEAVSDSELEEDDFHNEAMATILRALDNNHDIDTALLELNTLRMSMNVAYHEVRVATTQALVTRVAEFVKSETLGLKDAVEKVFAKWGNLFKRQVFEQEEQVDLLLILQNACSEVDDVVDGSNLLLFALIRLYDLDVLEEDQIVLWYEGEESGASEKLQKVKSGAGKYVQWLQEAEEESESDDE